jgi:hypothetical protein
MKLKGVRTAHLELCFGEKTATVVEEGYSLSEQNSPHDQKGTGRYLVRYSSSK